MHDVGPHDVTTLRAWPELSRTHDARARRTFEYFFLVIAGYFRARALQHWQLVLTPTGRDQPADCRHTHVFDDPPPHHRASAPSRGAELRDFD